MKFTVEQFEGEPTVVSIQADAFTSQQIAGISELADKDEHPDVTVEWMTEGVQIVLPADPAGFHVSVLVRDFFPEPFQSKAAA